MAGICTPPSAQQLLHRLVLGGAAAAVLLLVWLLLLSASPAPPTPTPSPVAWSGAIADKDNKALRLEPGPDGPLHFFQACMSAGPAIGYGTCDAGQRLCRWFGPDTGVSRPNTAVGRATYCMARIPQVLKILEAGTEKASATRMMAFGFEDAASDRVGLQLQRARDQGLLADAQPPAALASLLPRHATAEIFTIDVRRSVHDNAVQAYAGRFPYVHWILGGTVDSPAIQRCVQEHYGVPPGAIQPAPVLDALLQSIPFDAVFLDTTSCTGPDELDLFFASPHPWLLVMHDWGVKYGPHHMQAHAEWVLVGVHEDTFDQAGDYCECGAHPHGNEGTASVAIYWNPSRHAAVQAERLGHAL